MFLERFIRVLRLLALGCSCSCIVFFVTPLRRDCSDFSHFGSGSRGCFVHSTFMQLNIKIQ